MSDAQVWDLWFPGAGSQGLSFARGRLGATDVLLVHALPDQVRVDVRDDSGALLAHGDGLRRTQDSPIARLRVRDGGVEREDIWPGPADEGLPVLLCGGEAGILRSWWNDEARQEWRWTIELYNHR